ncbi:hypothetical protein K438DRAFT_1776639 [Mycena galopus ATCC 62051]|nr:hypothetical protein K438DRAFT_1776639 [Mycena galopus ATCC 62051]
MTTSFSGHCGQCGPGVCVGYSPLLNGHPCLCGHAELPHVLEQAVILPPTGQCLESGCIRFQSTTVLCGNPGHTPVSVPTVDIPSTVPSQAPPHSIWGRLDSAQTADGRRRVAAVRHRHRPYTMTKTSRISSQSIKPPRELTFGIWPFAMWDPMLADAEYPELYPIDFHLVGSERSSLATLLRQHDLLFKFQVPVKLEGSEDTDVVFYAALNTCVKDHMAKHHLRFSRFTPTDLPELPHTNDVELINAQHVERLDALGWTVLVTGIKPKSAAFERKINLTSICWYHFKLSVFSDRHYWAPIADPANPNQHIYFIGPKHCPLEGPLLGMSVPCTHRPFQRPSGVLRYLPSPTKARPTLATALVPVRSNSVTLLDTAANDSDEEADQLRQALALSVADAVPPPSTEAGPSSRPMSPSPLSTRRRLDVAETIDLTTSPSPVAVDIEDVDDDYFPDAGGNSPVQCCLTTPTVEAGVKALLTHFESFYSGNEYVAENQVDAVQIEPSGEFGLLARHGTWKRSITTSTPDTLLMRHLVGLRLATLSEVNGKPVFISCADSLIGASLKSFLLKKSAGRIQKPEDFIERLAWTYTGDEQFSAMEARYRMAFIRYLSGQGVVKHPRLSIASLTAAEREIPDDHPLTRALMFLMYATGSQLLPKNNSKIDLHC